MKWTNKGEETCEVMQNSHICVGGNNDAVVLFWEIPIAMYVPNNGTYR